MINGYSPFDIIVEMDKVECPHCAGFTYELILKREQLDGYLCHWCYNKIDEIKEKGLDLLETRDIQTQRRADG